MSALSSEDGQESPFFKEVNRQSDPRDSGYSSLDYINTHEVLLEIQNAIGKCPSWPRNMINLFLQRRSKRHLRSFERFQMVSINYVNIGRAIQTYKLC